MFDSQQHPFIGRSRKLSVRDNNGRSVNQEGKHEIHMFINFRQVNIAICQHLQLSLNARSCICEGVRSTVGHSVATLDYLYEIIKVFQTCSTRLFLCRPIQTSVVEHFSSSLLLLSDEKHLLMIGVLIDIN